MREVILNIWTPINAKPSSPITKRKTHEKISASHLRQLLSCIQEGLSVRVTAQKLGISKSAVSHLSHITLSYGGIEKLAQLKTLSDSWLLDHFYSTNIKAHQKPDWADIHKKCVRRNVTIKLLYDAYKSQAIRQTYTYTSFCRRYNEWRKAADLALLAAMFKPFQVNAWRLISAATSLNRLVLTVMFSLHGYL